MLKTWECESRLYIYICHNRDATFRQENNGMTTDGLGKRMQGDTLRRYIHTRNTPDDGTKRRREDCLTRDTRCRCRCWTDPIRVYPSGSAQET